jgi:class 3 adenylate cyclase
LLPNFTSRFDEIHEHWRLRRGIDDLVKMADIAFRNYSGQVTKQIDLHIKCQLTLKLVEEYLTGLSSLLILLSMIWVIYSLFRRMEFMSRHFEALKSILRLLAVHYVPAAASIVPYFRKVERVSKSPNDSGKSEVQYLVKKSLDSILIVSIDKRIQDINGATEELTQYTKGQMVGNVISDFISQEEDDGFLARLSFLCRQPVELGVTNRFNLKIVCRNGKETPCSCLLISLFSGNTRMVETSPAFAVVLRDRTMYTEQQKFLQIAQKRVETLLYRILPRVIATKLLSKKEGLTSKVEKATVAFIGIVNFLDWCGDHTHVEIMELLDVIFSNFDEKLARFPTLVKLKVVNGTYMAAGGLFNEVSEKSHELEMVEFAVECARSVHERNKRTGSTLELTVGINTGGPIIAGVLGIDKPLFDIWGDAVNVSARLQTSCPTGCIQMSQAMYNALPRDMFQVTERPGVFLKGKGDVTSYIIALKSLFK